MTIAMPRVRQTPTPNYTPSLIAHDLFVFHVMEGSYAGSVAWLCDPNARASATYCMPKDGSEVTQLVPSSMKAWAQILGNSKGCSLEIEGFTAQGMPDQTVSAAALIAAWHCVAYDIPPVWARGGNGRGLAQHIDGGDPWGGHHDCSPIGSPLWLNIVSTTQNMVAQLKALPSLPAFALHGAPGPHEVSPTPDVTPSPTHGGAARAEPDDTHDHPTPSKFPLHSIAALQADLNALMAPMTQPLLVDGRFGKQTQSELRAFQALHGLTADGLIGPDSWRAIDVAMAA